jgi:glycosyltransferase involved in cell wall biosynthesis
LLVPDSDPQALADSLVRLLSDPSLAAQLGAAARQRIETELTWEHTVARFEQVYSRVLHERQAVR